MKKQAIYKVWVDDECIFEGTIDASDRKKIRKIYDGKTILFVKTGSYRLSY